eukprot:c5673_g1_i1.p1 GENE.c5673_g1_i1~~c5673_g1_i1.p1  ORF type:complete len:239 (+),score=33.58 c5673_g1_i1:1-717(+)
MGLIMRMVVASLLFACAFAAPLDESTTDLTQLATTLFLQDPALLTTIQAKFFIKGFNNLVLAPCTDCGLGGKVVTPCSLTDDTVCAYDQCEGVETSPPDSPSVRSYSTIWDNNPVGVSHGQGRLDSPQAWSALTNNKNGDWAGLDLSTGKVVSGVIVQPRVGDGNSQRVTKFKVKYSMDGNNFNDIDGGAEFSGSVQGQDANTKTVVKFAKPQYGRYFRIYPTDYYGHMSMRWGVRVC